MHYVAVLICRLIGGHDPPADKLLVCRVVYVHFACLLRQGASENSVCVDERTATEFGLNWQGRLAGAVDQGSISTDEAVEIQSAAYQKIGLLTNED